MENTFNKKKLFDDDDEEESKPYTFHPFKYKNHPFLIIQTKRPTNVPTGIHHCDIFSFLIVLIFIFM